jgi:hypothetical protein
VTVYTARVLITDLIAIESCSSTSCPLANLGNKYGNTLDPTRATVAEHVESGVKSRSVWLAVQNVAA